MSIKGYPMTTATRRRITTRARRQVSSSCRCGQQLDVCATPNCPRCGRAVSHG